MIRKLPIARIRAASVIVLLCVVALWIGTALFGPELVRRFTKMSPAAYDRLEKIYNEEHRISALVRDGLLVPKPVRAEERPQILVNRVGCPAPLILDAESVYYADGEKIHLSTERFLLTPWRIYMLGEKP